MSSFSFPLRRAFIALPLEGEAKTTFRNIQERLKVFDRSLRLQNPASPHLTLQFWKELMEIEYQQVLKQTEKIAASVSPFMLKVGGVEIFGNRGEAQVLYLSVPFSEELARLKKLCPWPSIEPFRPHITLARVRHPQRFDVQRKQIEKTARTPSFTLHVDRLRLYSEIHGKNQTPMQDVPFGSTN